MKLTTLQKRTILKSLLQTSVEAVTRDIAQWLVAECGLTANQGKRLSGQLRERLWLLRNLPDSIKHSKYGPFEAGTDDDDLLPPWSNEFYELVRKTMIMHKFMLAKLDHEICGSEIKLYACYQGQNDRTQVYYDIDYVKAWLATFGYTSDQTAGLWQELNSRWYGAVHSVLRSCGTFADPTRAGDDRALILQSTWNTPPWSRNSVEASVWFIQVNPDIDE